MRFLRKSPTLLVIAGGGLILALLALLGSSFISAQQPALVEHFFPLTPGTYWLYRGTVNWTDPQTEKQAQADVTLKMTIQRVIQRRDFTIAILSGFPRDLDWATGEVGAMPWLLIETKHHEVFLDSLPPDFDYAKLGKDAVPLDKFLSEDNLLFRWPLKKGMKFGDAESVRRDDDHYCWVVATQETKKLDDIKGLPSRSAEIFLLQYLTNPDDTEMESPPASVSSAINTTTTAPKPIPALPLSNFILL